MRPVTFGLTDEMKRDLNLPPLMAAHAIADDRDTPEDWATLRFGLRIFHQLCKDWFPDSLPAYEGGDVWAQLNAGAEMIDRCTRREMRDSLRRLP